MSPLLATVLVVAHHLDGALALAFALPPILVVGGAVLWLRRREPSADEEFEWSAEDDELVHGRP
ncbi:hypothetical protein [Patulibacter americanus]|uniref:hypothetical protein n=1 Tax=Patulibacter americanus TaxID=588672 RepID=UPI0003B3174E|nr:hypothetical protein [Patulibacter americanus]